MAQLGIIAAILVGIVGVIQGAFNKNISIELGVAHTAFIGSIVTFLAAAVFFLCVKASPDTFAEFFRVKAPLTHYKWWFPIPAICGFIFIAALPFAFAGLGAVKASVILIGAQMITSVAWDYFVDGIEINPMKLGGILLAFCSVLMISFAKN